MTIRIVLAEDHQLMRQGLKSLIEGQPGMEVVGEAMDGRTAVQLARKLVPDLVIMDISMPDLNGIEATRQVVAVAAGVKVIGLSMHSDKKFISEMLAAGASGYLLKDCAFAELADAVRTVHSNQVYLSKMITSIVVEDYLRQLATGKESGGSLLSVREKEVLQMVAEGQNTKEIASRLEVSVKTVETHRQRIMQKLDLHSVAELTQYAIREGLTQLKS
jgi:DNA-binding NarL/FixJ family response regulator